MADDQNLCPHCGQPMPEATEETLGTPAIAPGNNTVKEENEKETASLSWEGETIDNTLPEQVEKLNQQIKEYEEENEDPDVENPQNEH